jgi:hypothetical protein
MDKKVMTMPNQSMLDMVLMGCGTLEGGMQMMLSKTDRCISDMPEVSDEIVVSSKVGTLITNAEVLQYLGQRGIVIGTAGFTYESTLPPLPALELSIVLKPVFTVVSTSAGPLTDHYSIAYDGNNPGFVNLYDLITDYLVDNPIKYESEDRYLAGLPSDNLSQDVSSLMPVLHIPYSIPWVTGHGLMMCWDANPTPYKTVTIKDVLGNSAYFSPLVLLSSDMNAVVACLAPKLLVEMVSSTYTEAVIRLTRSHDALTVPPLGNFNNITLSWIYSGPTGVPDPADPGNPDKILLTRAPGNHTFGVDAVYYNGVAMISYPSSHCTMVINIG